MTGLGYLGASPRQWRVCTRGHDPRGADLGPQATPRNFECDILVIFFCKVFLLNRTYSHSCIFCLHVFLRRSLLFNADKFTKRSTFIIG